MTMLMITRAAARRAALIAVLALAATGVAFAGGQKESAPAMQAMADSGSATGPRGLVIPPYDGAKSVPAGAETAVLAGGCFWGMEAVFEQLEGVYDVQSGYAGGSAGTADYNTVSSGTTGHAESVEIKFDPTKISFDTLLDVYFTVAHNPTELNYQGPDHGTQYRSAIFYENDQQKKEAEAYIAKLTSEKKYSDPIVTEVTPLEKFYPAETYHQNFMRKNPNNPYIVYWDVPKITELRKEFPNLLAGK